MLGYDVSFACIHAVKLAQQGALQEKKVSEWTTLANISSFCLEYRYDGISWSVCFLLFVGYLVCSMLLHESHEFVVLLVNTIQKVGFL